MATDIVSGLFGVTPESYQQQQDLLAQQNAMRYAEMTPTQQAQYGMFLGGQRLGGAIGQALGAQDPQLQIISRRQALMKQIDPSDPQSILAGAQMASQIGDTQFAAGLADYARKASSEIALAIQRQREGRAAAAKAIPSEIQVAQTKAELQDAIDQLKALPEDQQTPDVKRNIQRYQYQLDAFKQPKEATPNVKEVGVALGTAAPVYLDVVNNEQFTYQKDADGKQIRVPYFGGVDRTTAKVSATATTKGEESFAKQLGEQDAKKVADAMAKRDASIAALNSLKQLNSLDQTALISGAFASGRVGATNLLNTLGLASDADAQKLASSENYQKVAGDVVLSTLGGKLGAGFSNEDRKFIASLVPQLETSPVARKQLIQFMVKKNQDIIDESTNLETYARENLGLKGYVPKVPTINLGGAASASQYTSMSTEQLLNLRNQLTGGRR